MTELTRLRSERTTADLRIAFIGTVGIPNRYGGFESFLEHCSPLIATQVASVTVTCDAAVYEDQTMEYRGVRREFIRLAANGGSSIFHDLMAFFRVFNDATHVVVLGVSGGIWFPFFRAACALTGKKLLINIDGVEWRRTKFSTGKRLVLYSFDRLAQRFAHRIIFDNEGLRSYIPDRHLPKSVMIPYSGDHVLRTESSPSQNFNTALTICRIEAENQLEMLIEGALRSELSQYTVVGNWAASPYGRELFERYASHPKLRLLAPIYDSAKLAQLRQSHAIYLHGHSVGGTNPSLVEMLFYPIHLLCFDCIFNRHTAGANARYFANTEQLAMLIDECIGKSSPSAACPPEYTAERIASQYLNAILSA